MSHNLNIKDGRASMFYTREVPWHKLGTKLNAPATAKEAIEAALLDYRVEKLPIYAGDCIPIADKLATVRMDTKEALGVVSNYYRVIQNVEAFNFFDVLVGEGQAIYETAGALGKGERIWILAKLPEDIILTREDVVEKYLVLVNSHDGTAALRMFFSPIRVVCQNTLMAALSDAGEGIAIRHAGNIQNKIDEARRVLGITVNYYRQFEQIAKQLIDLKLSPAQANEYFERVLFGEDPSKDYSTSILVNRKRDLLRLFEEGKGNDLPGIEHSLWAAYNAVAEYYDFHRFIRGSNEDPSKQVKDTLFGYGASVKTRAYDIAYAMVKK